MSEALSKSEKTRLQQLVKFVRDHIATFVDVGEALLEIRETKLYREHGTFQDFCSSEFHINRRHAYQLCDAATVVSELKSVRPGAQLPTEEKQCRPSPGQRELALKGDLDA